MKSFISDILKGNNIIGIAGHVNPDGDSIGSSLGLYHYILDNYKDKKVTVHATAVPKNLNTLPAAELIDTVSGKNIKYDLFIVVDVSDKGRMGKNAKYVDLAKKTAIIDHHVTSVGNADYNCIKPEVSSTAEIICSLLEEDKISSRTAECLYTGIVHDTGVFKYQAVNGNTMKIAGMLVDKGVDTQKVIDDGFYSKTYLQNQILGKALLESMLFMDGRCIVSAVKQKDFDFYNVTPEDLAGIVEQLRLTVGVECAIFLYEKEPHVFKASLRSKEYVDVSKVAAYFGGGGHIRAAGCIVTGNMHDVITNIAKFIEQQMPLENN
jgi:Exopolyphosphatase-related proteins